MAGPLSLEEAKEGLNMRSGSTGDDAELTRFLGAATEQVESFVGPLTERTIVERHNLRGREMLALRTTPVIGVDSIVARYGAVLLYGAADLDVDLSSGIVRPLHGGAFAHGFGALDVTYRAGRIDVPEAIRTATIVILDHLWKTQRGWVSKPSVRGEVPDAVEGGVPLGFALPSRAVQLLEPYRQVVIA